MRMDAAGNALFDTPLPQMQLYRTWADALAAFTDEQRCFFRLGNFYTQVEPCLQRSDGVGTQRYDARFVTFASDTHRRIGEIQIHRIQTDQLGQAQAG